MKSKNILLNLCMPLVASALLLSCKEEVSLPDQPIDSFNKVYMPQSVNGTITKMLSISDKIQTLVYGASFGGFGYPDKDIDITFVVDPAMAAAYNAANQTSYPILPQASYTLSATKASIPKGKLSTDPLLVSVKTMGIGAMDALKTYILPITMSANGTVVNDKLLTTYYLVRAQPDLKDYPDFERSGWKVVGLSSEESSGEGPNNGRAIFAFDGNKSTFWHSKWSGGAAAEPPHFITVDLGAEKALHGLGFVARQDDGGGKPYQVNVQTSLDNVTWVNAGAFTLQNTRDLQKEFLPEGFGKNARYFKLTVNSSFNSTVMQIAELYAF